MRVNLYNGIDKIMIRQTEASVQMDIKMCQSNGLNHVGMSMVLLKLCTKYWNHNYVIHRTNLETHTKTLMLIGYPHKGLSSTSTFYLYTKYSIQTPTKPKIFFIFQTLSAKCKSPPKPFQKQKSTAGAVIIAKQKHRRIGPLQTR